MNVCILCKSNETNNLELGELKIQDDIQVHYFCMLLSSALLTNGEEIEGILGFLPSDIKKESRRAARLKCHYCHQTGATIGCCMPSCSHSFHLNCGLKNNCLNQFTSEYKSFCHRHVKERKERHAVDHVCIICYMEMGKYDKIQSIFAPCCKSEWFHKNCLMKLADSAGYFFKCPKCNDVQKFTDECMKRGIFIPQRRHRMGQKCGRNKKKLRNTTFSLFFTCSGCSNDFRLRNVLRDAAWETEENAYHELMERPNQCAADDCTCTDGRDSDKPSNELLICETCGSSCIHKNCWQRPEPYYCCFPIDSKIIDPPVNNENATDENQNSNVESQNNDCSTQTSSELHSKVRRKRRITQQLDDQVKQKKKRKIVETENFLESCSSRVAHISKLDFTRNNFPIKKIRNGTFDQLLGLTPRVLLCPLIPENLKFACRNVDQSMNKSVQDKSLKISMVDNDLLKKDLSAQSLAFAVISPTRKSGGKSFKNYTITSFFKRCN